MSQSIQLHSVYTTFPVNSFIWIIILYAGFSIPFDPYILKSKVKVFIELYKQKKALENTTNDLKKAVEELKKANQKILEQQKSVIEEERLKVLLQMAGATAHELNQPLMGLLGYIDLIKL